MERSESDSWPRLNYSSSFPSKRRVSAWTETPPPPLSPLASVLFQWEEAPGKPKPSSDDHPKPAAFPNSVSLHAAASPSSPSSPSDTAKLARDGFPSPTTVLHSPYGPARLALLELEPPFDGHSVMVGASPFSDGGRSKSCSIERSGGGGGLSGRRRRGQLVLFCGRVGKSDGGGVGGVSGRHSSSGAEGYGSLRFYLEGMMVGNGWEEESEVKVTRWRRNGRSSSLSSVTAHLLGAIYVGLKQAVVPWRRAKKKVPVERSISNGRFGLTGPIPPQS